METVHILAEVDGFDDFLFGDMAGEGQLHDESVHVLVFVELVHFGQKFLFADSILEAEQGRFKTAGFASQNLVAHVSLAASVMSHEDGSQMRALPSGFYDLFYLFGNFRLICAAVAFPSISCMVIPLLVYDYSLGILGIPGILGMLASSYPFCCRSPFSSFCASGRTA